MKAKLFLTLTLLQLIIIVVLGLMIYKKSTTRNISINPIKKDSLIFSSDGKQLEYFFEPKPNTIEHPADWLPFKASYSINSDALNERFEYLTNKPKDVYRIVTLGDSFTFGENVDTKDNWPEKLEDLLNIKLRCDNYHKFEVINLGVAGYDFQYSVKRYRIRGIKYNPDLVVWLMNDFKRIHEKIAPLALKYSEDLKKTGELSKLIKKGIFFYPFEKAQEAVKEEMGEDGILQYQTRAISKINDYYSGYLLMIPYLDFNSRDINFLREFVKKRPKTMIFDKLTNLSGIKNAQLPDYHPSSYGHKIIADDIYKYLTTNKIIPCSTK